MIFSSKHHKLVVIPVIAFAYLSCALLNGKALAEDKPAPTAPPAMMVETQLVEQSSSRLWKEFFGHLAAVNFVQIHPQVSGIITNVNFEDGQFVNKGDVLFVIDPRPYQAIVAQKEANLNTARNNFSLADKELKRSKDLLAKKMISQQVFDESANKKLISQAAINQAEASLLEAKINLDFTTIEAPISGRINRTELTEGNLVSAGSMNAPLLTSIVSQGKIYADFEIDEGTYIHYLQSSVTDNISASDIPVELRLQTSDAMFEGKIHSVDNRINPSTGTVGVRAIFDNTQQTLVPGMFAKIKLGSAKEYPQILINEHAIGTDQNRKFVYVISDGKASYREVTLGNSIKGQKVVKSGLNEGDEVIVSGLMKIRPNSPVKPKAKPENDSSK